MKQEIEKTTTISEENPRQLIERTKVMDASTLIEHPQKVYQQKKTLFKVNKVVFYIVGIVEVLLIFRFVLKALGANAYSPFTGFIYSITQPLVTPFLGILGISGYGNTIIEWSSIVAALVYLCVAWGIVYFFDLLYPVTPSDVELT